MAGTINAIAIDGITTYTSGTVVFSTASFANSNGISFGTNGSTITASYNSTQFLTTGMASDAGSRFVNTSAGLNLTNISATFNSNSISLSVAAAAGAQTAISGIGASDTTYTSGTVIWSGQNNITIGSSVNGASQYVKLSVGNYITTADLSQNSSNYIQNWKLTGNTAGTTSSAQGVDLWLAGGNNITVSGNSNTVTIQAGLGVRAWEITGNTAGTTSSTQTKLYFSGGNNVTLSGNSQTINISVGNYITTGALSGDTSKYVQAWELTGNTAGTTSSLQGTKIYFSGGNNMTVSGNSNTIVLSVANAAGQTNQTLGLYALGNTTGESSSSTLDARTVSFKATGGGISIGLSNSSYLFSVNSGFTLSSWEPWPLMNGANTVTSVAAGNATSAGIFVVPFILEEWLSVGVMNAVASMSFVTLGTSSGRQTAGWQVGIYSNNAGTLSAIVTTKLEWSITGNNSTYSISQPTATSATGYGVAQTTSAGVNITSLYTGIKVMGFPINTLLSPGQYWYAQMQTNSTNSINVGISISPVQMNVGLLHNAAPMGQGSTAYSTGSNPVGKVQPGWGSWTSAGSVTGLVQSMDFASISNNANLPTLLRFYSV